MSLNAGSSDTEIGLGTFSHMEAGEADLLTVDFLSMTVIFRSSEEMETLLSPTSLDPVKWINPVRSNPPGAAQLVTASRGIHKFGCRLKKK